MKKPAIADLTFEEINNLIEQVKEANIADTPREIVVETLATFQELLEKLKSSQISIKKLKSLLGFYSEQIKKDIQAH